MKIGDIQVLPVVDGVGVEVATDILSRPGVDDAWACHTEHLGADGTLELPLGGFCIRTGDRTVLVDAGVGDFDNGKYVGGGMLDSLRAQGIEPGDVTDVVFTHLHFDHVGWATHRGEIVFPHATYRAHRADWERFVSGPDAERDAIDKLAPIEPRMEPFDGDFTVAPGVDARHVPGHTPGSTVYIVSSGGRRALLLGDVAHSVVQLSERDWEVIWDVDPVAASAVRNALADEVADTEDLVAAAHFPGMRFGRVVTGDGPRRFVAL
ncbi:MBL fold metallo-hydrolase [Streptomyces sp. SID3343]|uniref:MBL fold metallo-hydrolase n=1 Tax=Streptomyces sp. SID3343 TaxID=2690260 RepID=UPI00136F364A|nr:MBL fold metallo-hydrolase [Streptomyces sp. SID3343]MYV99366.1 MBL fold metallo-hydrolase [Streptomyces sp. SID3343]